MKLQLKSHRSYVNIYGSNYLGFTVHSSIEKSIFLAAALVKTALIFPSLTVPFLPDEYD